MTVQQVGTSRGQAQYHATFGPQVSSWGDWVAFMLPSLSRGSTCTFVATVWGTGAAYLDVWNRSEDLASRTVSLGATPQQLSLVVTLPAWGVQAGNPPPQLQVRTHTFPTDVRFTAGVYRQ